MKATVPAKTLAAQLSLAASLADIKYARSIAALGAVRLVARGDLSITTNARDHVLTTTLPAAIEVAGEIALSAARLAALVAGFPAESEIDISSDDSMASIICGRSHFKLPTVPIADLPLTPVIDQETGRIELERRQLLNLIKKVEFAISTEASRFCLNGVCLHDSSEGLTVVATDSYRLARVVLSGVTGLSHDRRLIIPRNAIKILLKLLADKGIGRQTVRCSLSLVEIAHPTFVFISKLIDATFPDYGRRLPEPSGNTAIVERAKLTSAIERIQAVAPESKTAPMLGLFWAANEPALHVCVPGWPDLADDSIAAETAGTGRIAFQIRHGLELLDATKSVRVCIDCSTPGAPIRIADPDEPNHLIIQMPCTWRAEASQAAA